MADPVQVVSKYLPAGKADADPRDAAGMDTILPAVGFGVAPFTYPGEPPDPDTDKAGVAPTIVSIVTISTRPILIAHKG